MSEYPEHKTAELREIINTTITEFPLYQFDGPVQQDMSLLKLSYDAETKQGAYMMRMQPGAETIAHVHRRREEYLVLEGDLVESDGRVLGPGDYVIYQPGSRHNSRTVHGCLLIAIDYSFADDLPA
jgi:quercetin dioxygenase-like cupin family protein